jgi:renalase
MQVAIIGAGIAGLSCARRLQAAGTVVSIFDKGRSVGGRVSTRRVETAHGIAQFDHGAQFFTARDDAFRKALMALPAHASLAWRGNGDKEDWRVASPGLSALPIALAEGLDVRLSTKVEGLVRDGAGWTLIGENAGPLGRFDVAVLAVPAEQAAPVLAPVAPHLAAEAAQAVTAPCWAGLFAFAGSIDVPPIQPDLEEHPVLSWLTCDSAKPGRPEALSCWVAHAHPAWSRAHLEMSPEAILPLLFDAMQSVIGALPTPVVAQAHRWRFAKVEQVAGTAFSWDADLRLGVCGDWRLGPRVELAWRSGHAVAGAILP